MEGEKRIDQAEGEGHSVRFGGKKRDGGMKKGDLGVDGGQNTAFR